MTNLDEAEFGAEALAIRPNPFNSLEITDEDVEALTGRTCPQHGAKLPCFKCASEFIDYDEPVNNSVSLTAIANQYCEFTAEVKRRLNVGATVYGDKSFEATGSHLITEIQQEIFDVNGWSFILYCRLERLRKLIEKLEQSCTTASAV